MDNLFDEPDRTYPDLPRFRFETAVSICEARKSTQYETVRYLLEAHTGFWVCGSFFYGNYLQAARNRISELRRDLGPETIVSETCYAPEHQHRSRVSRYRWTK